MILINMVMAGDGDESDPPTEYWVEEAGISLWIPLRIEPFPP